MAPWACIAWTWANEAAVTTPSHATDERRGWHNVPAYSLKYSRSMVTTLKHPKLFSCWFNLQRSQDALCHFCEYTADISSQFLAHWWLMSMVFLLCQVQSHGLEVKLDSCCLVPSCSYIESGTELKWPRGPFDGACLFEKLTNFPIMEPSQ